jgi:hypothetical protein
LDPDNALSVILGIMALDSKDEEIAVSELARWRIF